MKSLFFTLLVFLFFAVCVTARAQIPRTLSYQGVLTDNNGVPLSGTKYVTFKLYDVAQSGHSSIR